MPILKSKVGEWNLEHYHGWWERKSKLFFDNVPLISLDTEIATIGSCFASELAKAMDRLDLKGAMHPTGLFYNTKSIRQELSRIVGMWPEYHDESPWKITGGYIHPFKDYSQAFLTLDELTTWSNSLDEEANVLFKKADVVVVTLGLIESWRSRDTGNVYRVLPHPEVFEELQSEFYRLTVSDMIDDLIAIRSIIKTHFHAEMIVTVSPVPLHTTMTNMDVRIANVESKSRIRSAVSEFIDRYPDVHYFHSYEIVSTTEKLSDFMMADGRHVHRRAVDYIMQQFLMKFAKPDVSIPTVKTKWLTPPRKMSKKVKPSFAKYYSNWRVTAKHFWHKLKP